MISIKTVIPVPTTVGISASIKQTFLSNFVSNFNSSCGTAFSLFLQPVSGEAKSSIDVNSGVVLLFTSMFEIDATFDILLKMIFFNDEFLDIAKNTMLSVNEPKPVTFLNNELNAISRYPNKSSASILHWDSCVDKH